MPRPYSIDLRERVLQCYDEGYPLEYVVQHFFVSKSWIYDLLKQRRENETITPMVLDGAINGKLFLAYVNQILLSTLHEGDIVVLDNLSSHKVIGVKDDERLMEKSWHPLRHIHAQGMLPLDFCKLAFGFVNIGIKHT